MLHVVMSRLEYERTLRELHDPWGYPDDDFSGQAYCIRHRQLFGDVGKTVSG